MKKEDKIKEILEDELEINLPEKYQEELEREIKIAKYMIEEGIKREDISKYTKLGVSILDELYIHYGEDLSRKYGIEKEKKREIAKFLIDKDANNETIFCFTELGDETIEMLRKEEKK